MMKKTFKLKGMHCTSCALLIESDLEDAGASATCNYAKEIVDVEYDPVKLTEQRIIDVIKSSGYQVAE